MIDIQQEFLTLMHNGGPIMWVILFVAGLAMIMLTWHGLKVVSFSKNAQRDYQQLRTGKPHNKSSNSPIAQLITTLNWNELESKDDITKEISIQLADITPKMEGNLATVAILATLLPMLGLLGTVTGMINVFEAIAIHGSGKPDEMADGISQALLTTASGLIIAIPVIFLHHLLSRRVDALMTLTHQAIQLILHRDIAALKEAYRHER